MALTKTLTHFAEAKTLESIFIRDEDERTKVAFNQFSNEISVISLAGIDEVEGRRAEICKKMVEACENWGIFQVIDHGIDYELIFEMTLFAREFFALPPEDKLRFDMSGGKNVVLYFYCFRSSPTNEELLCNLVLMVPDTSIPLVL